MQISITIDKRKLAQVERLLSGIKRGVPAALAGAVNDSARQTKTDISTEIRRKVAIKKKDIDPHIKIQPRATVARPSAKITLSETERLPLKYFGARQTKRGVTYRIQKGGGRKLVPSGFIVERFGGHAFKRSETKMMRGRGRRQAIVKLFGISPWGTFVKLDMQDRVMAVSQHILQTNLDRRVRFLLLKAQGTI